MEGVEGPTAPSAAQRFESNLQGFFLIGGFLVGWLSTNLLVTSSILSVEKPGLLESLPAVQKPAAGVPPPGPMALVPWRPVLPSGQRTIFTTPAIGQIARRLGRINAQHDTGDAGSTSPITERRFFQIIDGSGKGSGLLSGTHGFCPKCRQLPDFLGPNHIWGNDQQIGYDKNRSQNQSLRTNFRGKPNAAVSKTIHEHDDGIASLVLAVCCS